MSIWSSMSLLRCELRPVSAVDIDAAAAHPYWCTGPVVDVDVAIAPSWNDRIRLSVDSPSDDPHVCLALNDAEATALIAQLEAARAEIRRRRSRGSTA